MQKKGFTIIEVIIVFMAILGVTFFILPRVMDNTKQAKLISRWSQKYSELEYIFSVLKAQKDLEVFKEVNLATDNTVREDIVLQIVKPYLRIKDRIDDKTYSPHYLNNDLVMPDEKYYFDNFYTTENDEIVGIKWFVKDCETKKACGTFSYDVNGLLKPNTWGQDIFGINIYKDRIEPLGKNLGMDELKENCSTHGSGVYCSYYYLIGGKFD